MEYSWNIWGSSGWPYHVSLSRGFHPSLRMDGKHPFQRWWASWRLTVWTSGGISTDAPGTFFNDVFMHRTSHPITVIYLTYLTSMHHYASIYPCNSFRRCSISTFTCTYNSISTCNCCEIEQFSQISGFCWPFWCRIMANVASPKLMVSHSYWLPTPWAMFDVFSERERARDKKRERERAIKMIPIPAASRVQLNRRPVTELLEGKIRG